MLELGFVTVSVIGATELFRRLQNREYFDAMTIVAAAAIGIMAGIYGIEGATVSSGLVAGLTASGIVTLTDRVGKNRL